MRVIVLKTWPTGRRYTFSICVTPDKLGAGRYYAIREFSEISDVGGPSWSKLQIRWTECWVCRYFSGRYYERSWANKRTWHSHHHLMLYNKDWACSQGKNYSEVVQKRLEKKTLCKDSAGVLHSAGWWFNPVTVPEQRCSTAIGQTESWAR